MSGFGLGVSFVGCVQLVKYLNTVGQIVPTGIPLALAELHQEPKQAGEPGSPFACNGIAKWGPGWLHSSRKEEAVRNRFPLAHSAIKGVPGEPQI